MTNNSFSYNALLMKMVQSHIEVNNLVQTINGKDRFKAERLYADLGDYFNHLTVVCSDKPMNDPNVRRQYEEDVNLYMAKCKSTIYEITKLKNDEQIEALEQMLAKVYEYDYKYGNFTIECGAYVFTIADNLREIPKFIQRYREKNIPIFQSIYEDLFNQAKTFIDDVDKVLNKDIGMIKFESQTYSDINARLENLDYLIDDIISKDRPFRISSGSTERYVAHLKMQIKDLTIEIENLQDRYKHVESNDPIMNKYIDIYHMFNNMKEAFIRQHPSFYKTYVPNSRLDLERKMKKPLKESDDFVKVDPSDLQESKLDAKPEVKPEVKAEIEQETIQEDSHLEWISKNIPTLEEFKEKMFDFYSEKGEWEKAIRLVPEKPTPDQIISIYRGTNDINKVKPFLKEWNHELFLALIEQPDVFDTFFHVIGTEFWCEMFHLLILEKKFDLVKNIMETYKGEYNIYFFKMIGQGHLVNSSPSDYNEIMLPLFVDIDYDIRGIKHLWDSERLWKKSSLRYIIICYCIFKEKYGYLEYIKTINIIFSIPKCFYPYLKGKISDSFLE